ncbi:MAG: nitrite reductase [Planctomycetota bacterium]|nr:MAG: nitrite reductase [Planctomycetota bacterium]
MEVTITTHKVNQLIEPHLQIWGWEVAIYLFLGGLVAGILVLSSISWLMKKEENWPTLAYKLPLWGPILLSIGMFCLFLDLEHKWYVWRFYTAFHITSPMSWGAWILLLVYPVNILLILGTLKKGYPKISKGLENLLGEETWKDLTSWSEKRMVSFSKFGLPIGIALGIYTGILLSAFGARPFWNSAVLGPIFLASGISTALAFALLIAKKEEERKFCSQADIFTILVELLLIFLLIITLISSTQTYQDASKLILGGPLTLPFWIAVIFIGLLLPLFIEVLEWKGYPAPIVVASWLILLGGLYFRYVILQAGQLSSWIPY